MSVVTTGHASGLAAVAWIVLLILGDGPQDPPDSVRSTHPPASSPGEVVARVGDEVVTRAELSALVERMRAKGKEPEILRLIVERKLLRQKAGADDITIPDEQVAAGVSRTLQREASLRGMTREQLETQLRAQGWSPDDLRERERDRLILAALIRNRPDLLERTRVTPEEMRTYYAAMRDKEFVQDYAILLSGIKVSPAPGEAPETARAKADEVASRLRSGSKPEAIVAADDSLRLLDLGWVTQVQKFAAPIMEFVRSEPATGAVSGPLSVGTFLLVLTVRDARERRVHPFEDRSVQGYIRSRLEERKEAAIRRRYVFEVLDQFDVWPADLYGPAGGVPPAVSGDPRN